MAGMFVPAGSAWASERDNNEKESEFFSAEILKQRGIDPALAEYFSAGARFTPGTHSIQLIVNGNNKGTFNARFNEQGEMCFEPALLAAAGLKDPLKRDVAENPGNALTIDCQAFLSAWPLTLVELRPGENQIELVVPPEALEVSRDVSGYSSGGTAALLNYELLGFNSQYAGGRSQSYSGTTELGFNSADWIVRSRQIFSSNDNSHQFQHLDAYVQRSFAEAGTVFQAGQIRISNPILSGAQINGVQWLNEEALSQQNMQGRVEGIAQGPARVEVSQMGTLIYTTVVPAGPFILTDVPRISQRFDLDVTVTEADGSQQRFTVSSAAAGIASPESGYAYAVGQVRDVSGATEKPFVASASWSGALGADTSFSSGAMVASRYLSLGNGIGHRPWQGATAQWDLVGSSARSEGVHGAATRLTLTQNLGRNWSAEAAGSWQTEGYRELIDTSFTTNNLESRPRHRKQVDGRLGWSNAWLGSVAAGYSHATYFNGGETRRANLSWSKSLGYVSVSLSAERDLGSSSLPKGASRNSNSYYVSLNIPFGDRPRITTTMRESGGSQRYGISASDTLNDAFSYRLGSETNARDNSTSLNAGVSFIPRYSSVDLDYSGDGRHQNSISSGLRGGLVAHQGGLTATPYTVKETFGVVRVSDISGVKVNTPSGPVWTDGKGQAVISQLNGFGRSSIEIAGNSVPRNVDIRDGVAEIHAARGAVKHINFNAKTTRRVLMKLTTDAGKTVPVGALIYDQHQQPLGMVEHSGEIFLEDAASLEAVWVTTEGAPRCRADLPPAEQVDDSQFYEMLSAVCRS